MSRPWDKLHTETDEQYARFLLYRNLGPCRSLRKAYFRYLQEYDNYQGGIKGINPPHNWREDCRTHFWVERSAAWDVRNLCAYGARVAILHVEAVAAIAKKNLRLARKKEMKPGAEGWADLMRSMHQVQEFLTPDLVRGIEERNQPARQPALAAHPDDGIE